MRVGLVLASVPLLALLLPGCAAPPAAPEGAVSVTDPLLPGLVLTAWSEALPDGRHRLHALLENTGDQPVNHKDDCGRPWTAHLTGPAGEVPLRPGHLCEEYFYGQLPPGRFLDYRHTWDGTDAAGNATPAGAYAWTLTASLMRPNGTLAATVPFEVAPRQALAPED